MKESTIKKHLGRWCHAVVSGTENDFRVTGLLVAVDDKSLTLEAKDGELKTILSADVKELTSKEYLP